MESLELERPVDRIHARTQLDEVVNVTGDAAARVVNWLRSGISEPTVGVAGLDQLDSLP